MRPDVGELRLRVVHNATATQRWLHLHAGWVDTLARPGDAVGVILHPGPPAVWTADSAGCLHATLTDGREGLLVLHPDLLLSGTAVATALRCPRQAMLQERGVGGPGKAACLGTLMHELVQRALAALAAGTLCQNSAPCALPGRPLPMPRGALRVSFALHKWGRRSDACWQRAQPSMQVSRKRCAT